MISPLPSSNGHVVAMAGADISPAIRIDHDTVTDHGLQCKPVQTVKTFFGPKSDFDRNAGHVITP